MKTHLWSAALAGLALATAGHAQSWDVITKVRLTVPLQISNYAAPEAQLWCELLDAADRSLPRYVTRIRAGYAVAMTEFIVSGGSLNSTKTLDVEVATAALPNVRGWRCILTTADQYSPLPQSLDLQVYKALTPLAEIRGKF